MLLGECVWVMAGGLGSLTWPDQSDSGQVRGTHTPTVPQAHSHKELDPCSQRFIELLLTLPSLISALVYRLGYGGRGFRYRRSVLFHSNTRKPGFNLGLGGMTV